MSDTAQPSRTVDLATLDRILELQLLVAWAGEAETEPPRLGWWRTSIVDEYGGADLLARLTPRTWRWGVLQAIRAAAQKIDASARSRAADPATLLSLYNLGHVLDERLDERLHEHKRSRNQPHDALPALSLLEQPWNPERLKESLALSAGSSPRVTTSPMGRRLSGPVPEQPLTLARNLSAALLPLSDTYPLPHYSSKVAE